MYEEPLVISFLQEILIYLGYNIYDDYIPHETRNTICKLGPIGLWHLEINKKNIGPRQKLVRHTQKNFIRGQR